MYKNSNHFHSLNLFRGVAGYGVAICHFYYYLFNLDHFQFYSIFFVEFFFILSGFVLFPQLKKVYSNNKNLKIFYYRRWMRTLPPYILALLCYSILFSKYDSDTIKYLFFIQQISPNFLNFDYFSVAWSLSIEEFFYLIFPLFLIFFKSKKIYSILIIFIILIYLFKMFQLFSIGVNAEFYRIGTFLRLDSIAFGVLTRIFYENIKNFKLNLISIIILFFSMDYFFGKLANINNSQLFLFVIFLQLFSINLIIIFIHFEKYFYSKTIQKFFSLMSKQTYSIYLFHFFIIYIIDTNIDTLGENFLFLKYLVCLFLISTTSYYLLEKGIINNRPKYLQ